MIRVSATQPQLNPFCKLEKSDFNPHCGQKRHIISTMLSKHVFCNNRCRQRARQENKRAKIISRCEIESSASDREDPSLWFSLRVCVCVCVCVGLTFDWLCAYRVWSSLRACIHVQPRTRFSKRSVRNFSTFSRQAEEKCASGYRGRWSIAIKI